MAEIANVARQWIGTPYIHQASTRGAGADCLGLVRGVWREVVGPEPMALPPYTPDWSEPQRDEVMLREATRLLVPAMGPLKSGQVLLFRMRTGAVAKHMGIVGHGDPRPSFIHAYGGHGVVESPLSRPWLRRVIARFDFP